MRICHQISLVKEDLTPVQGEMTSNIRIAGAGMHDTKCPYAGTTPRKYTCCVKKLAYIPAHSIKSCSRPAVRQVVFTDVLL